MRKRVRSRSRRKQRNSLKSFYEWLQQLTIKSKILLAVAVVVFVFLLSVVIFIANKFSKMQNNDVKEHEIHVNELDETVGKGYTNIALFGVDARGGINEKGTRTDCIIIASLNNETKEVKLVSVYRDTLLDLSDGSMQKCNAAYSKGNEQQAISMLNMNLDLNIKDYVTVDWSAVIDTVDLLGGLEIDVKQAEIAGINEHMISTAQATGHKVTPVKKAGLQLLNGVQTTTYCRIRSTAGSDFARTERQRYVIERMFEKTLNSDLKTINGIVDKIFPKIKTSLTITEILSYAKSFSKYKIGETTGFPIEKTTGSIPRKGSCVIPTTLLTNVTMLHQFLFGVENYEPSENVRSISQEIQSIVGNRQPSGNQGTSKPSNSGGNQGGSPSGTDTPGTDTPGTDTPGTDTPGTDTPGTDTPGTDTPGTDTPGTDIPGTDTPGADTPGTDTPGTDTPGTDTPGTDTPGTDIPGTDMPGTDLSEIQ